MGLGFLGVPRLNPKPPGPKSPIYINLPLVEWMLNDPDSWMIISSLWKIDQFLLVLWRLLLVNLAMQLGSTTLSGPRMLAGHHQKETMTFLRLGIPIQTFTALWWKQSWKWPGWAIFFRSQNDEAKWEMSWGWLPGQIIATSARPHPKLWFSKGNPLISGKSRLDPPFWCLCCACWVLLPLLICIWIQELSFQCMATVPFFLFGHSGPLICFLTEQPVLSSRGHTYCPGDSFQSAGWWNIIIWLEWFASRQFPLPSLHPGWSYILRCPGKLGNRFGSVGYFTYNYF